MNASATKNGCAEEALDLARPVHRLLVLVGELVDPQDRDDVLQLLVALEVLLDLGRRVGSAPRRGRRLEDRRGRVERVHGGIDPLLGDPAGERRGRVQMREHRGRRRVGEVVRRHVDGLDRRHRSLLGGGDPLLESTHLGLERGLVADRRGHTPEQRRHLGARLDEPEDVVDEQQHVLAAGIAEVLGHRQPRQRHAQAGSRRLVHLAEDEHRLVDDARLLHLEPEVVALARALAHAAEGGQALVLLGEVADQLLDQHRLADSGAAEEADLAALRVGRRAGRRP